MEILVAILIIALIAAVAFAVVQRRPGGAPGLGRSRTSPVAVRSRSVPRNDPMAAAVAEHAQAMDPQDVIVAEQRLQAQARQVASRLQAEALRTEHQRAADQLADPDPYAGDPYAGDPRVGGAAGPYADGYAADPATDPRHDDPEYDGPRPAYPVDPRDQNGRRRV
jgi:Flp pilus assembly protein CpaB